MFLYSRQKASPSTQRLNTPARENLQRFDEGRLSHQRCAAASRLVFATRNASWTKKGRTRPKSHQKPRSRRSSILTLHHGHSRLVTRALKTTTGQTQLPQILTIVVRSTISELQKGQGMLDRPLAETLDWAALRRGTPKKIFLGKN